MISKKHKKSLRIMFLFGFPLYGTGSAVYTTKLAESLIKSKKQKVAIVTPDTKHKLSECKFYRVKNPIKAVFQSHPEYSSANSKKFSELSSGDVLKIYQSYLKDTIKAVEDFKPDVIHVQHASWLVWVANYIKSFYGVEYIVSAHGTGIQHASQDVRFKRLTRQGLRYSSKIIAVSHHTKKWLCEVFGKDLFSKTKVITGGVDISHYKGQKLENVKGLEGKYNLGNKKIVIYVGRVIKEKGVEYLVKAAPKINGEVFIIGGGSDKKRVMEIGKKIKNVHFLGYFGSNYIKDLRLFYQRADVMVVPSIWDEPLGLVILEAMACGTPVVASNKGGIPLAVKNNHNGLLIRPKSSVAIAESVNRLLSNKKLVTKLSKNAKKTVRERFDWELISGKILDMYKVASISSDRLKNERLVLDIEKEEKELKRKVGYY